MQLSLSHLTLCSSLLVQPSQPVRQAGQLNAFFSTPFKDQSRSGSIRSEWMPWMIDKKAQNAQFQGNLRWLDMPITTESDSIDFKWSKNWLKNVNYTVITIFIQKLCRWTYMLHLQNHNSHKIKGTPDVNAIWSLDSLGLGASLRWINYNGQFYSHHVLDHESSKSPSNNYCPYWTIAARLSDFLCQFLRSDLGQQRKPTPNHSKWTDLPNFPSPDAVLFVFYTI